MYQDVHPDGLATRDEEREVMSDEFELYREYLIQHGLVPRVEEDTKSETDTSHSLQYSMSSSSRIEQDSEGGDSLPTYDTLSQQAGPNSRFGRWQGWIEKRAAERYRDTTQEELEQRRKRGWTLDGQGDEFPSEHPPLALYNSRPNSAPSVPRLLSDSPRFIIPQARQSSLAPSSSATSSVTGLQVNTDLPKPTSETHTAEPLNATPTHSPLSLLPQNPPIPLVTHPLPPTHLRLAHFGSRFLPHTTSPLRCLLPIMGGRMLLMGHDKGLSVLDLYPTERAENGQVDTKTPEAAVARPIWINEGVLQMSVLEIEDNGRGQQQGVVLALVGRENDKDHECTRALRMYNLASLISLARWAVANKGASPVKLSRHSHSPEGTPKKHQLKSGFARSFKQLIDSAGQPSPSNEPSTTTYQDLLSPSASGSAIPVNPEGWNLPVNGLGSAPMAKRSYSEGSAETSRDWDVVDDLPLRWATDFVSLAGTNSRLINSSILFYSLGRNDPGVMDQDDTTYPGMGRGGALLGVATKGGVLLYENRKGERAFRFVKEFYTPVPPRSIMFAEQNPRDTPRSGPQRGGHYRSSTVTSVKIPDTHQRTRSSVGPYRAMENVGIPAGRSPHVGVFVLFEKKAGFIRLADASVGEIELFESGTISPSLDVQSSVRRPRSRPSLDNQQHDKKGIWISPARIELPVPSLVSYRGSFRRVFFLTKGKVTHIVPDPLPAYVHLQKPIHILTWDSAPSFVKPRVCYPPRNKDRVESAPFLQVIGFGEDGVEVQELALGFLANRNGKERAAAETPIRRSHAHVGDDVGLLCMGGHWHWERQPTMDDFSQLIRSDSILSMTSKMSHDSLDSEEVHAKLRSEQGVYGWCRKGYDDWRVFWVGGSAEKVPDEMIDSP